MSAKPIVTIASCNDPVAEAIVELQFQLKTERLAKAFDVP